MTDAPTLFPLGTAVEIKDDDETYVIIARGLQKQDAEFIAGYKVVPHPQGAATGVRELVVRQGQITKVIHRGYTDEKDAEFAKELLTNAKAPPKAPATPVVEPDLTVDLTTPAVLAPAAAVPSTALPTSTTDGVADPTDPFEQLRRKGKRT